MIGLPVTGESPRDHGLGLIADIFSGPGDLESQRLFIGSDKSCGGVIGAARIKQALAVPCGIVQ